MLSPLQPMEEQWAESLTVLNTIDDGYVADCFFPLDFVFVQ
ncbi:hypothetical protein [Vibrio sp. D173a]|nr:hypothetical protein [Vibrio sp. D173a]